MIPMQYRPTLSRRCPVRNREFIPVGRPALGRFVVRESASTVRVTLTLAPVKERRFSNKVLYIGRLGATR